MLLLTLQAVMEVQLVLDVSVWSTTSFWSQKYDKVALVTTLHHLVQNITE